jgi:hypothetical protein
LEFSSRPTHIDRATSLNVRASGYKPKSPVNRELHTLSLTRSPDFEKRMDHDHKIKAMHICTYIVTPTRTRACVSTVARVRASDSDLEQWQVQKVPRERGPAAAPLAIGQQNSPAHGPNYIQYVCVCDPPGTYKREIERENPKNRPINILNSKFRPKCLGISENRPPCVGRRCGLTDQHTNFKSAWKVVFSIYS